MKTKIITFKTFLAFLKKKQYSKVVVVSSKNVRRSSPWVFREMEETGEAISITVPDGEKCKEWRVLQKVLADFSKHGLDKKSLVVACGGGSVGDLVGLAASVYLRGLPYINIPTTLLSQVDSAYGGKNGINFQGQKNQIGTFYLPEHVVLESRFLTSLSRAQLLDGLGEILKYGFIFDTSILAEFEKAHTIEDIIKNKKILGRLIEKSICAKDHFVQKDYQDTGIRSALNVGHTIGHAVELKHKIPHGKAVCIGMYFEFKIMERLGLSKIGLSKRLERILEKMDTYPFSQKYVPDVKSIFHDKKVASDRILFPVVIRPGVVRCVNLKMNEFMRELRYV